MTYQSGKASKLFYPVMCLLNNSDIFIFAKGRFPSSLDLGQNLLSFSPPHVTLGIEVMLGEVLHDSVHQLAHAAEAAGEDRLLAQVSEEAFDQIHPGRTRARKMQPEARMACQPALDGRMFRGRVIVQNYVDMLAQRNFPGDLLQKC